MNRKKDFAVLILLLLVVSSASAGDPLASFIAGGDSRDNLIVLDLLSTSDLGEAVRYAGMLSMRQDAYVGDILTGLELLHHTSDRYRNEVIIRAVLEGVFFDEEGRPKEDVRLMNLDALTYLQDDLAGFTDSGLKAALLVLLPPHIEGAALKTLLRAGETCIGLAERNNGRFPGDTPREVRAFLGCAARAASLQVYSQVRSIYEISRDEYITALAGTCLENMERNLKGP